MTRFYDRYERLLFPVAMKLTRNRFRAEHLLVSVFKDVWTDPLVFLLTEDRHLSSCLIKHIISKHESTHKTKIG